MGLLATAQEMGVEIITGELPNGWWGAYCHKTHRIFLSSLLDADQRRSTLAHELGHANCRHRGSTPAAEAEAARYAARLLITPEKLGAAAVAVNWVGIMANYLGVMPSDVSAFYASLSPAEMGMYREHFTMEPKGFAGVP